MRRVGRYLWVTLGSLVLSAGAVGQLPEQFTLGKYVPGDAWLYIHAVHNPERDWIDKEWQEVFDTLKASGIDRDIMSAIAAALGEETRAKSQEAVDKWSGLLKAVRWGDLCGREFAIAERLLHREPGADYFLLTHGKLDSGEANFGALSSILKEIAALSDKIQVTNRELGGVSVWSMTFGGPEKKAPFSIELFRKGDVIGFTNGSGPLEEIVGLISGKGEGKAIVASPRFKEAIGLVRRPEDSLAYLDLKMVARDFRKLMESVFSENEKKGNSGENQENGTHQKILKLVLKGVDQCDMVDYIIESEETDGHRALTHSVVRMQPGREKCPLAGVCFGRAAFKKFDEFIPKNASSFSLTGFVDLEGLYKLLLDFLKNDIPDGEKYLETWNGILAGIGFDPQRDFFSWWSGEMISVTLPPAVVSPMGGADSVLLIRVKDGELAAKKVNELIDMANARLQAEGQMLMISPAQVDAEGFRQVTHPMLMMMLRPVVGVKGEWLIVGSSAEAVNQCLAVASGKAPSIVENERFKKEGLIPKGAVSSASFADTSKFGQELGQAIGMAGMVGGMMTAGMNDPDDAKPKQIVQRAMSAVMKLGPALQKIDFYSSESSMTTQENPTTIRTEKVVTYKTPAAGEAKTTNADQPNKP